MADSHPLDEIVNRPGVYFNPQTEVLIVVDDSAELDGEIFNMEEFEGADWVHDLRRDRRSTSTAATSCWRSSRRTTTPATPAASARRRASSRKRPTTRRTTRRSAGRTSGSQSRSSRSGLLVYAKPNASARIT